ncbi:MAG: type I-B CRISPR-associated protein Cas7/Cst2/DevR [Acidobacteria bacterium]|nr:type I-B CRISPR-associated protein Cas7/Cst2/DevR [Acidobacteriota bacterium]
MAFLTGLMLIDAPASALNNAGADEGARTENAIAVKFIRSRQGAFPYVSAQAFRYWLRSTLEQAPDLKWKAAPIFREAKIAYTDANPIEYWDDDLFGYMRAPSKKAGAAEKRKEDASRSTETPTSTEITRVSPFRVSTLVSLAPVSIASDFGTMTRHEGDPVPHEHQFYRAVLKGLVSLNLHAAGTFSYLNRTGYRNLDDNRVELAKKSKLEHLDGREKSYRLPWEQRTQRVTALLRALGLVYGGAKLALHYTDVTPAVFIGMVTKGGNNPLQYFVGPDDKGQPQVKAEAVQESLTVWRDQILSRLYVGWVQGFCDSERASLQTELEKFNEGKKGQGAIDFASGHPREILGQLAADLSDRKNADWLK